MKLHTFSITALVAIGFFGPTTAKAENLRVLDWNIANLAEGPGVSLRGVTRSEPDYATLHRIVENAHPDIVALQEVGSIPGAKAVLGSGYEVAFESRCLENEKKCQSDNDDIYTAIAFRRELEPQVSVFQIPELAILHQSECPKDPARPIRGGVGITIKIGEQTVWIPSLHMKASCKSGTGEEGETADDCRTQRRQFELLRAWINARPADDGVILTGDFNRRLLKTSDQIRQDFFEKFPRPRQFLPSGNRSCWARQDVGINISDDAHKKQALESNPVFDQSETVPFLYDPHSNRDIDFFIAEGIDTATSLAAEQKPMTGDYRFGAIAKDWLKNCDGTVKKSDRKLRDPRRPDDPPKPSVIAFSESFPSDHCPNLLTISRSAP